MKKLVFATLVSATAFIAVPAAAQTVTGTVIINGNVAPKCFVLPGAGSTFGTTVNMGELADADGTLLPSATLSSTFGTVGGAGLTAQVLCTSANPDVSVDATPLTNTAPADAGYDNSVDYTADVTFSLVNSGSQLVSDPTTTGATTGTLTGRLNGTGTNVSIATSAWNATGVLVSGAYSGQIVVQVSPGT